MSSSRLAAAIIALVTLAAVCPRVPHAAPHAVLGTNLSRIDDWSPEYTFADAFRASRRWISGSASVFEDQRAVDTDDNGWLRSLLPNQVVRTLMMSATPLHYPSGRYVFTYEGEGSLQWSPNVHVVSSLPGQQLLDVDSTQGAIIMTITAVNAQNYLRNMHVWMPGTGPGDLFNPAFIASLQQADYRVLRFMNWAAVDGNWSVSTPSTQHVWSDRPTWNDARWSFMKGVPIDVMVALANTMHADAWFSMSHLADDDYVRRFAQQVSEQLDPSLKVYIEHSDEVWNGNYAQAPYAQEHGLAAGLSRDPFQAQILWHAKRSTEIFKIFEEVFPPDRLVRVLSAQAGNPNVATLALNYADTRFHTDALTIAPYLDLRPPQQEQVAAGMTLDQFFDWLNNVIEPERMQAVRTHKDIARAANVDLIAYEGGQSFVAGGRYQDNAAMNRLFDLANRDPRMIPLYQRYLQDWSNEGGGVFVHFTHCARWDQYGRFGALEYLEQPREQAPKFDALLRWMGR